MLEKLKELRRVVLRKLKLRPIDEVFKTLQKKGIRHFNTGLEVFGRTGEYHTMNYAGLVDELHVWEISGDCEAALKKNLPNAKLKITDSYKEIENTPLKFDLVVIDSHQGVFGNSYCEHFEMLPKVLRVLKDDSVLIFNLTDIIGLERSYPGDHSLHHSKRDQWYGQKNSSVLSHDFYLKHYLKYFNENGFDVKFSFIKKRNPVLSYMVMGLKRN
jgi:hypothetical protein